MPILQIVCIVHWLVADAFGPMPQAVQAQSQDAARREGRFGLTALHEVHLKVTPENYQAMEPPTAAMPFGRGERPAGRRRRPALSVLLHAGNGPPMPFLTAVLGSRVWEGQKVASMGVYAWHGQSI